MTGGRRTRRRGCRYLITGGAGFIGSHLAEALAADEPSARIVILDDLSTGRRENLEPLLSGRAVEFVGGSVTDPELLDSLMNRADICVHLASAVGVQMIVNDPLHTLMQSVQGSNVVIDAAHRHNVRVLFGSTSEVYGKHTSGALSEDDDLVLGSPAKGRWSYAIAKSYGEALIHAYHKDHGVNATVLRLFNTVGPRQTGTHGMVLPRFISQAIRDEDLTVYGSGTQTRCFTHVADTVAAFTLLCACERAHGLTFNVGNSTAIPILELARRVIVRADSHSRIIRVPYDRAYGEGFEELGSRTPDTSALRNLTGWRTQFTVDDAIDHMLEFERGRVSSQSPKVSTLAGAHGA